MIGGVQRENILTTSRMAVTTWVPGDLHDLHRLHSDPVTMRYIRFGRLETLSETRALIDEYMSQQTDRGWTKWRVADDKGHLIGRAGFGEHERGRELGYTLTRELWGQGLATELASALVQWHRGRELPRQQLWAYAAVMNPASCRVLEKIGFRLEGKSRHEEMLCRLYRLPDSDRLWGVSPQQRYSS